MNIGGFSRLKARVHVIAAFLLLTTLLGGLTPRSTEAQTGGLYIALGDSVAAGIGSSLPRVRSYPAVLAQMSRDAGSPPLLLENLAVPGETASTFRSGGQLERFREVVRMPTGEISADLITVTLGGNEMLAGRNADSNERQEYLDVFTVEFPAALGDIRAEVGPDVPIIVTTYYDLIEGNPSVVGSDSWWIAQFNAVIEASADDHGATVVDIASIFRDNIRTFTYYPFDVHPTNAGHRAIAQAIWSQLGRDTDAPSIEVLSPIEVTRATPTIRFSVSGAGISETIALDVEGARMIGPFKLGNGTYAVLLDFAMSGEAHLSIVAADDAGNATSVDITVTYAPAVTQP
jgi:acyl-CoA thioesterase I